MASGQVRIIGGKWRGRKLGFPPVPGLRPSLGRVRETLFNWLVADIAGARCLDLFAGSGALGLEALSRGAASVGFVDANRRVTAALQDNLTRLGADHAAVRCQDARRFIDQSRRQRRQSDAADPLSPPWDLVLLDPPFDDRLPLAALIEPLRSAELLKPDGLVYLERARSAFTAASAFARSAGRPSPTTVRPWSIWKGPARPRWLWRAGRSPAKPPPETVAMVSLHGLRRLANIRRFLDRSGGSWGQSLNPAARSWSIRAHSTRSPTAIRI